MDDIEVLRDETAVQRRRRKKGSLTLKRAEGSVSQFPRARFEAFCKQVKIQSKDYGLVSFKMIGTQKYILDEVCQALKEGITTITILKARQIGASTFFLLLDIFWAMEYEGLLGIFATHEEASRDQFRNQIELFFQTIPRSHQVGYETSNRTMLVLKNASLFRYLVAGTRASTNKMGRSGGCNYCHATEIAFWGSGDDVTALAQTFSELYPHRLYVAESTANGFNHFYDMCEVAKESPAQRFIFVGWWRNELYEFGAKHPLYLKYMPQGTQTSLTKAERKMVREVREQFDYQINAGQLAWWRHHLETKCNNDLNQMMQEMPATPEQAFVSTGSQFFTNEALTEMMKDARRHTCMPMIFKLTKNIADMALQSSTLAKAELKIWEEPSRFGKYVIAVDPAFGSSPDSDNAVITIYRCYADIMVQVAEYASTAAEPYQIAWILAYLCGLYVDIMCILEMNGAGSAVFGELGRLKQLTHGVATSDEMALKNCLKHVKEYLYRREDSLGGGLMRQWVTSPSTKPKMMERYKTGVETGRVRVRSMACLEEHRKIVRDGDQIAASGASHDDRVIGSALAYWAWDQWIRPPLISQGRTLAKESDVEKKGGPDPVTSLVEKFMMARSIRVPDEDNA